ncbi:MAG: WecB/TagA/CpsF family glycosyltransferase [Patescibacteria group bacterium]|nr:WecB/TagA/CpsF family glycosyltransferase [Patescibacteria group bacterium]
MNSQNKLSSEQILGVRVDQVNIGQARGLVLDWLQSKQGKHLVTTPNVEFILLAQQDAKFRQILNGADLNIPDSARIGWAKLMLNKSKVERLLYILTVFLPKLLPDNHFPTVTGVDLVESLASKMAQLNKEKKDLGLTIGLLGGKNNVAKKAADCLAKKYPGLKIAFANDGPQVDQDGKEVWSSTSDNWEEERRKNSIVTYSACDLLLVGFGQGKQEKWITNNLKHLPVKVAMGVGGTFDYLSGEVPRAPQVLRNTGLEWFYRLLAQPWRVKRQLKLFDFIFLVLTAK